MASNVLGVLQESFPGYLRATPELNSSSTEGTNILWPFISYCAWEMSEAYLWWLLLDIREEHCLVVSVGTGSQDSWVIFRAMPLTLKAKRHDLVSSSSTGASVYLTTPQVGWQHLDNSVIQRLLNPLCVASAAVPRCSGYMVVLG